LYRFNLKFYFLKNLSDSQPKNLHNSQHVCSDAMCRIATPVSSVRRYACERDRTRLLPHKNGAKHGQSLAQGQFFAIGLGREGTVG
jgi:hypothetical protein